MRSPASGADAGGAILYVQRSHHLHTPHGIYAESPPIERKCRGYFGMGIGKTVQGRCYGCEIPGGHFAVGIYHAVNRDGSIAPQGRIASGSGKIGQISAIYQVIEYACRRDEAEVAQPEAEE